MFVNDLFKLIENSNEEYYAVYNQRGKPMIMRKPAGKTAEAYAEEKNLTIKGGPFDSHQETESFWIRSVLPAKKEQGIEEAGPFSYGSKKPRKGSVADLAAQKRKEQERGKQPIEPKDQRVGVARVTKSVAEGISVVDQDYDLDQLILTLDIEGKKVYFTYWDYEEDFANAERRDVFNQLQEQPWYKGLDHPTKMEILDAAFRAIRGLEPQEYRPTVRDEPLDEQGVAEGADEGLSKYSTERLQAYVKKVSGGGVPAFGSGAKLKRVQQELKRREQGVAEGSQEQSYFYDFAELYSHPNEASHPDPIQALELVAGQYNDPRSVAIDIIKFAKAHPEELRDSAVKNAVYQLARSLKQGVAEGGFDIPEIPRAPQPRPEPKNKAVGEGSVQDKLHKRHQELRKKRGAPDPEYYQELKKTYDMPDDERWARTAELKKKYKVSEAHPNQQISRYNFDGETYRGEKMPSIDKDDILQRGQQVDYQPIYGTEPYSSLFGKDTNDNDDPADQQSLTKILNQYLNQLPARFRQILTLRFYKGQTLEEIAQQFGLTAARIREIEAKALRMLAHKAKQDNLKAYLPAGRAVKNETTNYKITNEDRERYVEELERAGYEIVTEAATLCPECGGAAYADQMLAEKQDACYHKVKSRYKVWPSAYASGALVRCRKKGAANWGNKSKK